MSEEQHWDEAEAEVPAGEFLMGRPLDDMFATEEEQPQRRVRLSAYAIDHYPVTNRRFRAFVEAGGYSRRELWSAEGWDWLQTNEVMQPASFDDTSFADDAQPASGLTWYEAQAFCRFAGRRLPTSAEWERAARGEDGRQFPWGEVPWPHRGVCNFGGARRKTTPVGTYPLGRSPHGLFDMAGNVNNWVEDVFWSGFGAWCVEEGQLVDPLLTPELARRLGVPSKLRIDRGGGYLTDHAACEVLSTTRPLGWAPSSRAMWHGFRTARSLD